jgi:branched-chain amino acid transport system ATP-binding protein
MSGMLVLDDIKVAYGEMQALWGVSLRVKEGEIVALIGSNGAGKTTTLKTISGLLKPLSGSIRYQGIEIIDAPAYHIVDMGISQIPEGRKLFPQMSVRENLEIGCFNRRAREHKAETLEWVYRLFPVLKEKRAMAAGTMSGGEQQMIAIGRGLMAKPKLLMLDEPSLGLAPLIVRELFDVLEEVNRQGITILLVEQNVMEALEIADTAYVMETGRITLSGDSREISEHQHVKRAYLGL